MTLFRILRELRARGTMTPPYPSPADEPPPTTRGVPTIDPARCAGNADCADICPTSAITVGRLADGDWRWQLDRAACVACGACIDTCPANALSSCFDDELAARSRADLLTSVTFRAGSDTRLGSSARSASIALPASADASPVGQRFRHSLHVRHLDAGSSNAEDWELNTLLGPRYDLQRFGIDLVASPRHADLLVVTGAVTRHLVPALRATYEATPEPKIVLALGTDACSGGITRGSYATAGGVDTCIPVDVYVPGDPPRPRAILHALLLAMDRREQRVQARHTVVRK